jgi:NAD(P)H-dependent FMN reductase/riboflavin biosynthesis pyrimidine reductase
VPFEGLEQIPPFCPDTEAEGTPSAVDHLRRALARSDAVLIASPEYGHSLPGALKNAIDWVIGSGELTQKPVAITAAVPIAERGRRGLAALAATLRGVAARTVANEPIVKGDGFEDRVRKLVEHLAREARRADPAAEAFIAEAPSLQLLHDASAASFGLPAPLRAVYGGDLGIEAGRTYANFVASTDGVVAIEAEGDSGPAISGGSESDRLVMGLLRALADTVVVGAGTFRRTPGATWNAQSIYPAGAPWFAEVRRLLGLAPNPTLVVVTRSGTLDVTGPALEGAIVATTTGGRTRLAGKLPSATRVRVLTDEPMSDLFSELRGIGTGRVLTEGGPTLFSELVHHGLVDELFLTTSPVLLGRSAEDHRKSLVEGTALDRVPLRLVSARRDGSHLFLRYGVTTP